MAGKITVPVLCWCLQAPFKDCSGADVGGSGHTSQCMGTTSLVPVLVIPDPGMGGGMRLALSPDPGRAQKLVPGCTASQRRLVDGEVTGPVLCSLAPSSGP